MKLLPIVTEKSMKDAKNGRYSFRVLPSMTKYDVREGLLRAFGVHALEIKTMNAKREEKRSYTGRKKVRPASKKVVVKLRKDEKIDLFDVEKGKE